MLEREQPDLFDIILPQVAHAQAIRIAWRMGSPT